MSKNMFAIGESYIKTRKAWTPGTEYNFKDGGHELRLFVENPTRKEIDDYQNGEIELRLCTKCGLLMLVFKFGNQPWCDASYNWNLVPAESQILPEDPDAPDIGATLAIFLVDAHTGILKVMRVIGMGNEFTKTLHSVIRKQMLQPFDRDKHFEQVELVYKMYSSNQMAQLAICSYRIKTNY